MDAKRVRMLVVAGCGAVALAAAGTVALVLQPPTLPLRPLAAHQPAPDGYQHVVVQVPAGVAAVPPEGAGAGDPAADAATFAVDVDKLARYTDRLVRLDRGPAGGVVAVLTDGSTVDVGRTGSPGGEPDPPGAPGVSPLSGRAAAVPLPLLQLVEHPGVVEIAPVDATAWRVTGDLTPAEVTAITGLSARADVLMQVAEYPGKDDFDKDRDRREQQREARKDKTTGTDKADRAQARVARAQARADEARADAERAQAEAEAAQAEADRARADADRAGADADKARKKADKAQEKADRATERAARAWKKAARAQEKADRLRDRAGTGRDRYLPLQWALDNDGGEVGGFPATKDADVDGVEANTRATGDGVVVAVIDTGIQPDHPDLPPLWHNPDETCDDGVDDDGNGYVDDCAGWDFANHDNTPYDAGDDNDHGTHVAGTIVAVGDNGDGVAGLAPDASVMSLKITNRGASWVSDAAEAVRYAVDQGADVINISFTTAPGTPREAVKPLEDAIAYAGAHGVLVVAAAGNDGVDTDGRPVYPAGLPLDNVVSVGASTPGDGIAPFSNIGRRSVDLFAPGLYIPSTVDGDGYAAMQGTSAAAPHVSAAAALILEREPELTPAQVRDTLVATADDRPAFADKAASDGRLNADRALGGSGIVVQAGGFNEFRSDVEHVATLTVKAPASLLPPSGRVSVRATVMTTVDGAVYGVVNHPVTVDDQPTETDSSAQVLLGPADGVETGDATLTGDGMRVTFGTTLPAGQYALVVDLVSTADPRYAFGRPVAVFFAVPPAGQPAATPGGATPGASEGATTQPPATTAPPAGEPAPTTAPPLGDSSDDGAPAPLPPTEPAPGTTTPPTATPGGPTGPAPTGTGPAAPTAPGQPAAPGTAIPTQPEPTQAGTTPPGPAPTQPAAPAPPAPPATTPTVAPPTAPAVAPPATPAPTGSVAPPAAGTPPPPAPAPVTHDNITIASVGPSTGPAAGGNAIMIKGANFPEFLVVSIGGTAGFVSSRSSVSLTVIVPSGVPGALVDVTVADRVGNAVTMTGAYRYDPEPASSDPTSSDPAPPATAPPAGAAPTAPATSPPDQPAGADPTAAPPEPTGAPPTASEPQPTSTTPPPPPGALLRPGPEFGAPISHSGLRLAPLTGAHPLAAISPADWPARQCSEALCQAVPLG